MTLEWRGTALTSVAILAQVPPRGGNFEVGGVGKGNVARSHAKWLPPLAPQLLHLLRQGFGVLELATVRLEEAVTVAGQLADELGLGYEDYLAEAVYLWIQEVRESAKLEKRLQGLLAPRG